MFTSYEKSKCGFRIVKSPCGNPNKSETIISSPTVLALSPTSIFHSRESGDEADGSPIHEYTHINRFEMNHREIDDADSEIILDNVGNCITAGETKMSPPANLSPLLPIRRHRTNIVEAQKFTSGELSGCYTNRTLDRVSPNTSPTLLANTKLPSLVHSRSSIHRNSISSNFPSKLDALAHSAVETREVSPLLRYRQLTTLTSRNNPPMSSVPTVPSTSPFAHLRSLSQPLEADANRTDYDDAINRFHKKTNNTSPYKSPSSSPTSALYHDHMFPSLDSALDLPSIQRNETTENFVGIRNSLGNSRINSPPSYETLAKLNDLFSPRPDCDFEEVELA